MPLPVSSPTRAAMRARNVAQAWLLELFCTGGTLRIWDQRNANTIDGSAYEAGEDKWGITSEIKCGRDLVPQPLVLWLDGATQFVDGSFTKRFLASKWHTRRVRLRQLICVPGTNFTVAIGVGYDFLGFMDTIDLPFGKGASKVGLNCESGSFRAKSRYMTTVTDADQRRRDATDGSLKNIGLKPQQEVPFGEEWSNIPGSIGGAATPAAPSLFRGRYG